MLKMTAFHERANQKTDTRMTAELGDRTGARGVLPGHT